MFHCKIDDKVVEPTNEQMALVLSQRKSIIVKCPTPGCPTKAVIFPQMKGVQYHCVPFEIGENDVVVTGRFRKCEYNETHGTAREKIYRCNSCKSENIVVDQTGNGTCNTCGYTGAMQLVGT